MLKDYKMVRKNNLIPDKWEIKQALSGVKDVSHILFDVYTHTVKGEKQTEIMVMMTQDDYNDLIRESNFWEKMRNGTWPQTGEC